jgi:hypothetical protein
VEKGTDKAERKKRAEIKKLEEKYGIKLEEVAETIPAPQSK